tara:strand:- start:2051 stop:2371 length:321 start_codon:yes stop_codon:yes gene_type:complete
MARYTDIKYVANRKPNGTQGKEYYGPTKYPEIPLSFEDTYVYAEQGDRYDQLALQYYGNSNLWWVISIANESIKQNSYYLPLGVQVRIPANLGGILAKFKQLNNRQ